MDTYRRPAMLVGALFIIGTVAGILSVVVTAPLLGNPANLSAIAANQPRIVIGALLVLAMGLALALVPVVLFPIAKHYSERLALGYVVFRGALEPIAYIGTAIPWLALIVVSREYVQAGAPNGAAWQAAGATLLGVQAAFSSILVIIFSLGALMLYTMLYQSRLIPHWLSIWGVIAITMHLAAGCLQLFAVIQPTDPILFGMSLPILVQELVMAIWLIAKGFNTVAAPAHPAELLARPI